MVQKIEFFLLKILNYTKVFRGINSPFLTLPIISLLGFDKNTLTSRREVLSSHITCFFVKVLSYIYTEQVSLFIRTQNVL